jgi:hypothetical protein
MVSYEDLKTLTNIKSEREWRPRMLYYQWMPFFLIFQAICFRAPSFIYKFMVAKSGAD